jgi:hypothetical protein
LAKLLQNELKKHGFKVVQFTNNFAKPWSDGYVDLNIRVQETRDTHLVGELQVHLCTVKKFTEILGHKFFEVLREITDKAEKALLQSQFDELSKAGYKNAQAWPEKMCLAELKERESEKEKEKEKESGVIGTGATGSVARAAFGTGSGMTEPEEPEE